MQIWNKGGKVPIHQGTRWIVTRARNIRNGGIYLKGISRVRDDRWLCFHVVASICRSKPAKRKVVEHLASYFTSCSKWHRKPVVWKSALIFEFRFYVSQHTNAKRFMLSWEGEKYGSKNGSQFIFWDYSWFWNRDYKKYV